MADRHAEERRTLRHLADGDVPEEIFGRRLHVVVSAEALAGEAGQVLALTVARLAPRFCHRLTFSCPEVQCAPRLRPLLGSENFSSSNLAALARLVWPEGEYGDADPARPPIATLGIGAPGDLSIGVDPDGAAALSRRRVVSIAADEACVPALVAAAVGCAEAAKELFPEILRAQPETEIRIAEGPLGGPLALDVARVEIPRTHVAGAGAVGSALVYALICAGATGQIVLVDPDHVSDSNAVRYVLFDERHHGLDKVAAAQELVKASGRQLAVEPHPEVLQSYLGENPGERERLELLISAVDSYEARRELAGLLSREVLNAGTTASGFTVSRHLVDDGHPCLACQYPVEQVDVERDAVIARETGIDRAEVAKMLVRKSKLTEPHLRRIEQVRGLEGGALQSYLGEPLDTLHNKVICGTMPIASARGETFAPLAFGSALAGFSLAHSLLRVGAGLPCGRYFRVDFLRGLTTPMRHERPRRDDCLVCGRPASVLTYRERWGDVSVLDRVTPS